MSRMEKREPRDKSRGGNEMRSSRNGAGRGEAESSGAGQQDVTERRVLRSRYLAVKNLINDERDDISRVDSDKFKSIIGEVESLHHLVQKPREQVADAEALLDIANTLVSSVKSQSNEGVTPSDFITSLLQNFGQPNGGANTEETRNSLVWGDIGLAVSHIFRKVPGCCTMLGPMNTEMKQRKAAVQRKRVRPTESACPEDLNNIGAEEKTDTDNNMFTMFGILRKRKNVRLENLVLNRTSFAQTVENLFALSFLVKDGRVEITVDDNGYHLVSPRNAPAADAVASGDVSYSHFVFRFDFKDWKLLMDSVGTGEELMPHRSQANTSCDSQGQSEPVDSQTTAPTTPIRKLSRNRGLVIQEQSVVEESPQSDDATAEASAIRKGKRKLR